MTSSKGPLITTSVYRLGELTHFTVQAGIGPVAPNGAVTFIVTPHGSEPVITHLTLDDATRIADAILGAVHRVRELRDAITQEDAA